MKTLLFVFGTRPEAIKLAPLIIAFKNKARLYRTIICVTGQHQEMLDQVLQHFGIVPDYNLKLMKPGQGLPVLTAKLIENLSTIIDDIQPDYVFVQGDTTTAFAGALAGYYSKVSVVHIEAGLRSMNKYSPFPEEINRLLIARLADYHFAPTKIAARNLRAEGLSDNVWVVGNTVVDALLLGLKRINHTKKNELQNKYGFIDFSKKVILVTGHRRESFGEPFENICKAIKKIALTNNDVQIVYPVHLNPCVQQPVKRILKGIPNVHLLMPLPYVEFIWLLSKAYLVLTDSGGVQEEAPSLGIPVVVMRDVTERVEGVSSGQAVLCGTDMDRIYKVVQELLDRQHWKPASKYNPYGDGNSINKIINCFTRGLRAKSR